MAQENSGFAQRVLLALAEDLDKITPAEYRPPRPPVPEGGRKLGELNDYERRLYSLLMIAEEKHQALHEATGLPFGMPPGLSEEHRQLHLHMAFVKPMLGESLGQSNPIAMQPGVNLCNDWGIYLDDDIFPGLGGMVQVIMI